MKLLALLATAVYGNLVATLYPEELQGYSKALLEVVNNPQTLYYAADGSKCFIKISISETSSIRTLWSRFERLYIQLNPNEWNSTVVALKSFQKEVILN